MKFTQVKEILETETSVDFQVLYDSRNNPTLVLNLCESQSEDGNSLSPLKWIVVQQDPARKEMILGIIYAQTDQLLSSLSGFEAEAFMDDLFQAAGIGEIEFMA